MRLSLLSIPVFILGVAVAGPASAVGLSAPLSAGQRYSNMSPSGYVETGSTRVSLERAERAILEQRYAEATRILNDLVVKLDSARVYRLAALASAGSGDLAAAESHFARAVQIDRLDPGTQAALGLVQLRQGKRSEATLTLRAIEQRQRRCASNCQRAEELDRAAQVLSRALS